MVALGCVEVISMEEQGYCSTSKVVVQCVCSVGSLAECVLCASHPLLIQLTNEVTHLSLGVGV